MDRKQFWKEKYRKDHFSDLIISLVFSVVIVFLLKWRSWLVESVFDCIIAFLVLVAIDLIHFAFRMNQYVNRKLAEEAEKHTGEDSVTAEDLENTAAEGSAPEDDHGEVQE